MKTEFEYIETYYIAKDDMIKLSKEGGLFKVISISNNVLILLNPLNNERKLINPNNYFKVYKKYES